MDLRVILYCAPLGQIFATIDVADCHFPRLNRCCACVAACKNSAFRRRVGVLVLSTCVAIALSGCGGGIAASYAVNLTWDAPTSSSDPVAGYNVYRSSSGGSYYQRINPTVVTVTEYEDTTVQRGQSYDYMVESVDASGMTSDPSNTAAITIP